MDLLLIFKLQATIKIICSY